MRTEFKEKLAHKGWAEEEIKKAEPVLENAEKHDIYLSRIAYYSALMVIILANLLASVALMFLAIVIESNFLYIIVASLGVVIGFLYNYLVTDIGHLEKHHHIFGALIIPLVAIFNIILIVVVANTLIQELGIGNVAHTPWLVGVMFAVPFLVPSIIEKVFFRKK